jgi:hypothetical protein
VDYSFFRPYYKEICPRSCQILTIQEAYRREIIIPANQSIGCNEESRIGDGRTVGVADFHPSPCDGDEINRLKLKRR